MEEKKDSKQKLQNHQQEQTEEEKPDKQVEADQAEKDTPVLEKNQLSEDIQKERHENKVEISVGRSKLCGKDGERQTDSSKKSKQGSKRNAKEKHTVPQPFSFATDKRMSKERRCSMDFSAANEERMSKEKRGSIDFKAPQPKLSKSFSINHKVESLASAGETSKLTRANSTRANITSSTKLNATTTKRADKRIEEGPKTKEMIQVKEVESKYLQVNTIKKQKKGEELEINKLRKTSTRKTAPLQSFYNQKDPPSKPGLKKIPVTCSKSTLLDQQSMSTGFQSNKIEDKGKLASKTMSSITKILIGTRKILNPAKEKVKGDVSGA
ncbi:protein WVD2-like 3 [Corylus avellana]|uniref:protein WVD2-like 3 n=1 Tax=Corylus avellana TaxID=13451 RepID=UPI00286BA3E5|nr:protein WVD2-like 3 [Corylus avellana]